MTIKVTRRRFLGQASCAAVGSASLFSTLLNMRMANTAAAHTIGGGDDYKALVCLFLAGGNDSFNMLVPRGNEEYNDYASIRSDLALAQDTLLPITPLTSDGREYGIHPSMPEVKQLFDAGDLAFVANVGTLVEPTTLAGYESGLARLPLGLYSHSDQITHWQTSVPDRRSGIGWGGRTADLLHSLNKNNNISMNISLSGSNVFQAGQQTVEYSIVPEGNGSIGITGYGETDTFNALRTSAIESMLDLQYQNLFQKTFVDVTRKAMNSHTQFSAAIGGIPAFTTQFSNNEVSQSFQMVAKSIAARNLLGFRRQTFFIMFGGWDHHDEVINNQQAMLTVVSKALGEFNSALQELGVQNDVVTFTASDFGRTLTSNGEGSDHAWGGNHLVMGGAVKGGDIYGQYPALYADNDLDTGRGRLIPTTSCDEYFGEMALWFGVDNSNLDIVLPNIGRFYDTTSSAQPLGYLQQSTPTPPPTGGQRLFLPLIKR